MDRYPNYFKDDPRALLFITGSVDTEPDIHSKLQVSI
jgi:hypothetical protein